MTADTLTAAGLLFAGIAVGVLLALAAYWLGWWLEARSRRLRRRVGWYTGGRR